MKNLYLSLKNIGVKPKHDDDAIKKIQIFNQINLATVFTALVSAVLSIALDMGSVPIFFSISIVILFSFPLILLSMGEIFMARIFYLIDSYVTITVLPILLGPELHYQYFLIAGIGMPLIYIDQKDKVARWSMVVMAIPTWLFLEWYFTVYQPLFEIQSETAYWIRISNNFLLFVIIAYMIHIYTSKNQKLIETIKSQRKNLEEAHTKQQIENSKIEKALKEELNKQILLINQKNANNFILSSLASIKDSKHMLNLQVVQNELNKIFKKKYISLQEEILITKSVINLMNEAINKETKCEIKTEEIDVKYQYTPTLLLLTLIKLGGFSQAFYKKDKNIINLTLVSNEKSKSSDDIQYLFEMYEELERESFNYKITNKENQFITEIQFPSGINK